MNRLHLRVPVITVMLLLVMLGLVAATDAALAARWAGHQTGGGDGTVLAPPPGSPPEFVAVGPARGTAISFGMEAKADPLVPAPVPPPPAPPPPPDLLVAAPGATIQGHAKWIDHSTSPPRVISLTNPISFRCSQVTGDGSIVGWGTDSSMTGPVWVNFRTVDGQAPGGPPVDQVFVTVRFAPGPRQRPLYAAGAVVSGEVVQHSCGSGTVAARWRGHQTGGGDGTVLAPPPPFAGVSPLAGTSVSFGFVAKADSLAPAPPPAAPTALQDAPGATVQGHGEWVDHSTSPPRRISLTTPVNFQCNPVNGQGAMAGWGTDSSIAGPVFVLFNTFDGDVPGGPGGDRVTVRVFLAPPAAPPAPTGLYWANAAVNGEVVQHRCE